MTKKKDPDGNVGYGRPPKEHRFKPGKSGNPRGRPKGSKDQRIIIDRELSEKVQVKEGDRVVQISKREAIIKQTVNRAMSGDLKAVTLILAEDQDMQQQMQAALKASIVKRSDEELIEEWEKRQKTYKDQSADEHDEEDGS